MRLLIALTFISFSAGAQVNMGMVKDYSMKAFEACKEDKSKIKMCESFTEMDKLKTCLLSNKEKLSEKCKTALTLVK